MGHFEPENERPNLVRRQCNGVCLSVVHQCQRDHVHVRYGIDHHVFGVRFDGRSHGFPFSMSPTLKGVGGPTWKSGRENRDWLFSPTLEL